ncbi:MAG: BMP family ABC transporter substrate-binding protein [Pseudomonadota bacterium]|jgi:basic membrane lipoprotein Med (substrate-binding protein (PBP1-ABC) superfamily)
MTCLARFSPSRRGFLSAAAAFAALPLARPDAEAGPAVRSVAGAFSQPLAAGWAGAVHGAATALEASGGIAYSAEGGLDWNDQLALVRRLADEGAQVVLADAYAAEAELRALAAAYPSTRFVLGSSFAGAPAAANVMVAEPAPERAAFLAGVLAGSMAGSVTRPGGGGSAARIAAVGSYPITGVNRMLNAFRSGVRLAAPGAGFMVAHTRAWADPDRARKAAEAVLAGGADVVFADATVAASVRMARPGTAVILQSGGPVPDSAASAGILAAVEWDAREILSTVLGADPEPAPAACACRLRLFDAAGPGEALRAADEALETGRIALAADDGAADGLA